MNEDQTMQTASADDVDAGSPTLSSMPEGIIECAAQDTAVAWAADRTEDSAAGKLTAGDVKAISAEFVRHLAPLVANAQPELAASLTELYQGIQLSGGLGQSSREMEQAGT